MDAAEKIYSILSEAISDNIFEAVVSLESDRGKNLTHILNQLRGVCGVTIVGVLEPARPVSALKERTILKVKFFRTVPHLRKHLKKMTVSAKQVDGVYSFLIRDVKRLKAAFRGN